MSVPQKPVEDNQCTGWEISFQPLKVIYHRGSEVIFRAVQGIHIPPPGRPIRPKFDVQLPIILCHDGSVIDSTPWKVIYPGGTECVLNPIESKGVEATELIDGPEFPRKPNKLIYPGGKETILTSMEIIAPDGSKISPFPEGTTAGESQDSNGPDSSDSEDSQRPRQFTPSSDSEPSLASVEDPNGTEVSLQYAEDLHSLDRERPIFMALKATLQSPTNLQVKSEKLVDDILLFCRQEVEGVRNDGVLWWIWWIIIDIARCIPAGHLWQDSLIVALESLRQREDGVYKQSRDENPIMMWEHLPTFGSILLEQWSDPCHTGEDVGEEFAQWKNLNSFIARLTNWDFAPLLDVPFWQLRSALEEPTVKGPAMECRMWVVTEWISQCSYFFFYHMTSGVELNSSTVRSLRGGSLCDGISPLSLERWGFWKRRLSEIISDAGTLELNGPILDRISDALESMNAVGSELEWEVAGNSPVYTDHPHDSTHPTQTCCPTASD